MKYTTIYYGPKRRNRIRVFILFNAFLAVLGNTKATDGLRGIFQQELPFFSPSLKNPVETKSEIPPFGIFIDVTVTGPVSTHLRKK